VLRSVANFSEEPLDQEVGQLQAGLEQIYRTVVLLQKHEPDVKQVAEIWSKMVSICDEFARRLSTLIDKSSKYRFYYDRILGFRNAAEERRALHTSA